MKKALIISSVLLFIISSCMVGKKYERPEMPIHSSWHSSSKDNTPDSISHLKWFEIFHDSVLKSLIDTALKYNYNLANASLRIEQARSAFGIAKADLLPSVGYSAGANLNGHTSNDFKLLATASWEIDFWGKLRHAKRAAYANILASEEGMKSITIALISDISTYYFMMRDLDNRLAIARRSIESRSKYFELVNARFRGGDVAELDMLQADQQLQIAKATASNVKRQLNAAERSLNILLGQTPQSIQRGVENTNQQTVEHIPSGLPSSLLEQRPDIKQAEYYLQAETERLGVTQAMRFPNIALTGFFGLASSELSSLISNDAIVSNAAAGILGPIFSFGANKRRVEIQRYEAEIAANNYIQTYVSALAEVENALVAVETYADEYTARRKQAEAASRWLMLSQERYNSGYSDYLEVLLAENAMFDSELQASATKAQQLSSYIFLYRALGGGWESVAHKEK